jgi:hypothetical protein
MSIYWKGTDVSHFISSNPFAGGGDQEICLAGNLRIRNGKY